MQRMMDKIAALEQYSKALQSQNELLLSSAGALARQCAHAQNDSAFANAWCTDFGGARMIQRNTRH
jgi:hypothetical protein